MPRVPRNVWPDIPHHVTQRGNRRTQVFFSDADYRTYLAWMHGDARRYGLEVLAYCLMSNHVHLVAVPTNRRSFELALRHLHMRYAQRINRRHGWKGHLWQGRFFASALDESYFWCAVRYVERNPVKAGLVGRAEDYPWSSARAHCEGAWDPLLSMNPRWSQVLSRVSDWSSWLAAGDSAADVETLRTHTRRGLPCGSRNFIESLEDRAGRPLALRPRGRPRRRV